MLFVLEFEPSARMGAEVPAARMAPVEVVTVEAVPISIEAVFPDLARSTICPLNGLFGRTCGVFVAAMVTWKANIKAPYPLYYVKLKRLGRKR